MVTLDKTQAKPNPEFQSEGNNYLVVIALDKYTYFNQLNNSLKNGDELVNLLEQRYLFKEEHIIKVYDKIATKEKIIDTFVKLREQIDEWNDNLLIFFSGNVYHDDDSGETYYIPINARYGYTLDYINQVDLYERYISQLHVKNLFIISDGCINKSLFVNANQRDLYNYQHKVTRWGLCSGRCNDDLYETSLTDNSPFMESLLKYLRINNLPILYAESLANNVLVAISQDYKIAPEAKPMLGDCSLGKSFTFKLRYTESEEWQKALEKNTLRRYDLFLMQHPDGQYADEAAQKITELNEDIKWNNVLDDDTLWGYNHYISNYSNGRYVEEARQKINQLSELECWNTAVAQNSLSHFIQYRNTYREGRFIEEAKTRITELLSARDDKQLWLQAKSDNNIVAYEIYIERFPEGKYVKDANSKIQLLKHFEDKEQNKITNNEKTDTNHIASVNQHSISTPQQAMVDRTQLSFFLFIANIFSKIPKTVRFLIVIILILFVILFIFYPLISI